jgi:Mrp family chromosome partitioning ATPase
VSALVFLTALLTLVLIPRQASRAARLLTPSAGEYPDTAEIIRRVVSADSVVRAADSAVTRTKARAARVAVEDSLPPALAARRDSLTAEDAELARALQRAEMSPLSASYRAVASVRALRGNPRVAVLIDSLGDVERARVAFGEAGGVDPIYVALTARLNAIGRSIQGIAEERRDVVRGELARLGGGNASAPAIAAALAKASARRDSVARADSVARGELARARATVVGLRSRAERARELVNVSAPPIALLAAALVLGAALGFAVTFGVEVWRPRVADAGEAERMTGVRTLAVLAPRVANPERARRSSDRTVSPLIDASSTEYRLLYLALAGTGLPLVTVTGDESDVVATVAANIAVAGALDSRSTLLVDADPRVAAASGIVAARLAPGVSDVLAGTVSWPEAIVPVSVGRDRSLDVIPAGSDPRAAWPAQHGSSLSADSLRAELSRLARRYDLLVIAAPAGLAQVGPDSVLPGPDVVLTARLAYTTLARLTAAASALRTSGMQLRGLVLWDADSAPVAPHRRGYGKSGSLAAVPS